MKKLAFETDINAPKEKVWNTLWDDATYRQWTAAFQEGSHAVTDWKEGSKILFLDGKGQGMVSKVAKRIDNEYMSVSHWGMVMDGKEITTGPEIEAWAGAEENYTLTEKDGITKLQVTMDMAEEDKMAHYFKETWPKALGKLKEIAES